MKTRYGQWEDGRVIQWFVITSDLKQQLSKIEQLISEKLGEE